LQVSARLPEFRLSMREFCTLQPGSVISTGIPRNADIDVFIGAQRRYLASPGRVGSALAVRLAEGILPPPEPITIPINRQ
jgi:flagellar motor switch protein FliM